MVLRIFIVALRSRDRYVFMRQSLQYWTFSIKTVNFETYFLKNENPFRKTRVPLFSKIENILRLKTKLLHIKLLCQNPMLRQIEWGVQNGPIPKNGVLPVTTSFFLKFCFSLGTSYKELIWYTNHTNVDIHTFRNSWSFIWGYIFLWVSLRWII